MIEYIPELVDAGIDSFKIEGRMKTALYVAVVARTYRKAIDDYYESEELYRKNLPYYREEIAKCTYRQFTTGFFFHKPKADAQIYDNNVYVKEYTYLGIVREVKDGFCEMEQRNKFCVGDEVEIMTPSGEDTTAVVEKILAEDGSEQESCPHPQQKIFVKFSKLAKKYDLIRCSQE